MNNRIKELRKELNLTMEKFGERLGVGKSAINKLEKGENKITDQMFKSICREFNVNPDWLQNGTLPMFNSDHTEGLEEFIRARQVDGLEAEMLRIYFSIEPEVRRRAVEYFKENFLSDETKAALKAASAPAGKVNDRTASSSAISDVPATEEELKRKFPPVESAGETQAG